MDDATKPAWLQLVETGTLVQFRVLDTHTEPAPDMRSVGFTLTYKCSARGLKDDWQYLPIIAILCFC